VASVTDILLDTGFNKAKLKTPYKLLWMVCFAVFMILLYGILGDYGIIGAMVYAALSYFLGKGIFFLIVKTLNKDIYYTKEYLDQINKK